MLSWVGHERKILNLEARAYTNYIGQGQLAELQNHQYSRPSLYRLRLSRITAYLDAKIWSLFLLGNLPTGYKILWERGEIARKEQFLLFSAMFLNISRFRKFDMSRYGYLEVFKRGLLLSR